MARPTGSRPTAGDGGSDRRRRANASGGEVRDRFTDLTFEQVLVELGTSAERGLGADEVGRRWSRDGPNEIAESRPSTLVHLARQFWGPTAWMLEFAAGLAAVLGNAIDAAVVLILLVFNATIGFSQDRRALRALDLLRARL
ncbi:MAG: cation-transporting P-type ATPase [Thermoplasmata archaeon]